MNWAPIVQKCAPSSVLVQLTGRDSLHIKNAGIPSSKSENGITTLSASGVVVDAKEGLIVTSGSIVIPFLVRNEISQMPKDNHTLLPGTDLSILLHGKEENNWEEASLVGVWACESVAQCMRQLGSAFQHRLETGWADIGSVKERERDSLSLATTEFVAVVRLTKSKEQTASAIFGNSNQLLLGQPIAIIGSPFGCVSPIAFFNSVSSGVIAHTFHGHNGSADLLMVDARILPGTEGGGVYDASGCLVGIVAPHVTSTAKPMDLNFVIPSNQIADLLANIGRIEIANKSADEFLPRNVQIAKKSVVCLQIGNTWASGILVSNNGHILTNAHLFKSIINEIMRPKPIPLEEYSHLKVKVFFNTSPPSPSSTSPPSSSAIRSLNTTKQYVLANVEYISHNHLDIALLKMGKDTEIINKFLLPVKASLSVDSAIGMPVWVVANGFAPEQGMEIVCSQGTLSHVILREGVPASLQTSACVHSGNSGGPLVNSNGELVGMIMSHATHKSTRTFTQLNFCIPYQQFITLINYANGEDKLAIDRLRAQPNDNFLANLWKFSPEPKEAPKMGENFTKFLEQMKTNDPKIPPVISRSKL